MADPDVPAPHAPRPDEAQTQPRRTQTQPSPDVPPHIARVLEMITDGFIALDEGDHYVYVNRQAEAILGRSRKELLGLNIWEAFPGEAESDFAHAVARARAEDIPVTCENHAATLGLWIENQIYPAPDGLLFVYCRDITEARRIKDEASRLNVELRHTVEEFQALFDLLPVAVLVAEDPACTIIRANPAGQHLLTVQPEANVSMNLAEEKTEAFRVMRDGKDVPPDQLPMQVAAATGQEVRGSQCQIVRSDGSESVIYGHSSPLFGADGKTRGSIGAFLDVTPLKHLEADLQANAERLRRIEAQTAAILESIGDAFFSLDADWRFTYANAQAERHLLRTREQLLGRIIWDVFPAAVDSIFDEQYQRAVAEGVAVTFEAYYPPLEAWSSVSVYPAQDGGLSIFFQDVTERKQGEERLQDAAVILEFQKVALEKANAILEELATTDGLTGLSNHRAFQERLAEEVSRAIRNSTPLSLILLDVDYFKPYNDTFGHPAGDAVLQSVARLLGQNARETDIASRYGGEEFALILPQTEAEAAAIIAERLRAAVENHGWPMRSVTASLGVANLRRGEQRGAGLIARADRALYDSKEAGRNRVSSLES